MVLHNFDHIKHLRYQFLMSKVQKEGQERLLRDGLSHLHYEYDAMLDFIIKKFGHFFFQKKKLCFTLDPYFCM